MKIVWVTNDVWFSKLLRFLFSETTSHVGVLFSTRGFNLAIDINRPYGSLYSTNYWLHKYRIIHEAEIELTDEQEFSVCKRLEHFAVLRPYDMPGYYYGMIWGVLHKLFRVPLPLFNAWSNHRDEMCQCIIHPVLHDPVIQATGIAPIIHDFSAMTPDMTMHYLEELTKNNPAWKWKHYDAN